MKGNKCPFSSVQFSRSVVSDSLWPHESQYTRPPCPTSTPGVHSDSCPLSRWCHPAISSSFISFSSWPQSLTVSGSFPISQLLAWGGQSTGVSASALVLPVNTQDWSPLGLNGWDCRIVLFSEAYRTKVCQLFQEGELLRNREPGFKKLLNIET